MRHRIRLPQRVAAGILAVLGVLCLSSGAMAQFTCTQPSANYTFDTLKIESFSGRPGDTIRMPLYVSTDSVIVGFSINVRYDSTVIRPLVDPDTIIDTTINNAVLPPDTTIDTIITQYLRYQLSGRALGSDADQRNAFSNSIKIRDSSIIKLLMLPTSFDANEGLDTLPGGNGVVMYVSFVVQTHGLADGATRPLSFAHLPVLDVTVFPFVQLPGCDWTALTEIWEATIGRSTPLLFPVRINGSYTVGAPAAGECTTPAQCTTPPANFQLPAIACNAGVCQYTPINNNNTNSAPSVIINGVSGSTSITVQQGAPVQFTVSSSDANSSNQLTLSAVGTLPQGAVFNTVSGGASGVSSVFTWTPGVGQSTAIITFRSQDNSGQSNSTTTGTMTVVVEEPQFDKLYSTSDRQANGQGPVGGVPGFKFPVFFPVDLLNSVHDSVFGAQFDVLYPYRNFTLDSIITTARTPFFIVDYFRFNDSSLRIVTYGLSNERVQAQNITAILQMAFSVDSLATPGTYDMTMSKGRISIDPSPLVASESLLTLSGAIDVDRFGDVNSDDRVDIGDLVSVIGYIIGAVSLPPRNFAAADVVITDSVDVVDLVGLNNIIYGLPIAPAPPLPPGGPLARVSYDQGDIIPGEFSVLTVTGELPEKVSGVEMRVRYNPAMVSLVAPLTTVASDKFRLQYRDDRQGTMRIVCYCINENDALPVGLSDIIQINALIKSGIAEGDLRLSDIVLANPLAQKVETEAPPDPVLPSEYFLSQNYPNPFNPETQIDFSLPANGASAQRVRVTVYNILGQAVKTLLDKELPAGQHTVRWRGDNQSGKKVASGVYMYRLEVEKSFVKTKKMVLIK